MDRIHASRPLRFIAFAAVALTLPAAAQVSQPERPAPPDQRSFGLGLEAGVIGIGADLHLGSSAYGLYLGGSLTPVLLLTQTFGTTNVDVRASGDFRAGPYLYFVQTERARFGLLGGGSWNTLLGPGFNLGVGAVVWLGRNLDLQLSWTVAFYPAAADHLRSAGVTGDPSVPWLQGGGIAIGLLFHP